MTTGKMIQKALAARGMSQSKLARVSGIPATTLSGYITGRYKPDYSKLVDIANALGVTRDYLIGKDSANILGDEELSLVLKYRDMDNHERGMLIEYAAFIELQRGKRK